MPPSGMSLDLDVFLGEAQLDEHVLNDVAVVAHEHNLLVLRRTPTRALVFQLGSYLLELVTLRVDAVDDGPGLAPFAVL